MRKFLLAASLLTAPFLGMAAAHANPIAIGYSINGGGVNNISGLPGATSGDGTAQVPNGTAVGSGFSLGVQANGFPTGGYVSPNFTSTTIDAQSVAAGTLTVYVTESNIAAALGAYPADFGFSVVNLSNATITEAFYLDTSNGTFDTSGAPLATATFSGTGGLDKFATIPANPTDYSVTGVYTITFKGKGNIGAGESFTDIPEPASLALLGVGLAGLGMIRRRKRNDAAA